MAQKRKIVRMETGVETRNLPAMPIHVEFQRFGAAVSLANVSGEPVFTFERAPGEMSFERYWEEFKRASIVSKAFFAVKTPLDALVFLGSTGFFLLEGGPDPDWRTSISWNEFQKWQDLLRFVSQNGFLMIAHWNHRGEEEYDKPWSVVPSPGSPPLNTDLQAIAANAPESTQKYLQANPDLRMRRDERIAKVQGREPKLEMSIMPSGTVEAILANLYIDEQIGISYKLCLRKGCGELFIANDKRGKQYCSQKCAHHANVTRDRARKGPVKSNG